jgi:hypothetical protein
MKVVVSGSTGLIGSQVLAHCLEHPSITSVIVLTRRALPSVATHAKAKILIVSDFTSYPPSTIAELQTADAAVWCLGTYTGDEKVDIAFPLTFIAAIKARPTGPKPFRYIQLGGALTEPPPKDGEQPRSLWYFANGRRVRGMTETRVLEAAEANEQGGFEVHVVKPAGVVPKEGVVFRTVAWVVGDAMTIGIDELAAAMVDLTVHGGEQSVLGHRDLLRRGRAVLGKRTLGK